MLKLQLTMGFAAVAAASVGTFFWAAHEPVRVADRGISAASADRLNLGGLAPFRYSHHKPVVKARAPYPLEKKPYAAMIHKAAKDAALDPALVHAVIFVESGYDAEALSPMGAVGLMQVMPETAQRYGVDDPAHSPAANLRAGTRYLRALMRLFDGRLELVLAAYNAGEGAVLRHGRSIPPYKTTQRYVPAVLNKYHEWRATPSEPPTGDPVYAALGRGSL